MASGGLQRAEHLQVRPPVRGLPDQVRRGQRRRDDRAQQQVPAAQQPPLRGDREAGHHRRGQEPDRPLGLGRDPDAQPDGQPPAGLAALQQPEHQVQQDRPGHEVGRGRAEQVHAAQVFGAAGHAHRGEQLPGPPGAEDAAHAPGEQDQRAEPQRGQHPQPDQGVGEQQRGETRGQRGQRRLIHVPEGGMASGFQEIQLVTVIAVPGTDRHLDRERHGGDNDDAQPGRAAGAGQQAGGFWCGIRSAGARPGRECASRERVLRHASIVGPGEAGRHRAAGRFPPLRSAGEPGRGDRPSSPRGGSRPAPPAGGCRRAPCAIRSGRGQQSDE